MEFDFLYVPTVLELISILNNILLSRPNSPPMLNALEVEQLKEILSLLQVMEKLTVEASGEQYVTVSIVIPLINCAIKNLSSVNMQFPITTNLKNSLEAEIEKRFGLREQVNLLALGTFLDPRFKNVHFNDAVASSKILQKVNSLVLDQLKINESESSSSESEIVSPSEEQKEIDIWSFHKSLTQKQHLKSKQASTRTDSLTPEVRMYLSAPLSPLKENPIELWEELKGVYPNLYIVARKYLSVVSTSVPSERLFSKAGATITQARNRLSGKLLPKLLFLNSLPKEYLYW